MKTGKWWITWSRLAVDLLVWCSARSRAKARPTVMQVIYGTAQVLMQLMSADTRLRFFFRQPRNNVDENDHTDSTEHRDRCKRHEYLR